MLVAKLLASFNFFQFSNRTFGQDNLIGVIDAALLQLLCIEVCGKSSNKFGSFQGLKQFVDVCVLFTTHIANLFGQGRDCLVHLGKFSGNLLGANQVFIHRLCKRDDLFD